VGQEATVLHTVRSKWSKMRKMEVRVHGVIDRLFTQSMRAHVGLYSLLPTTTRLMSNATDSTLLSSLLISVKSAPNLSETYSTVIEIILKLMKNGRIGGFIAKDRAKPGSR
jgi:hypothetical protein